MDLYLIYLFHNMATQEDLMAFDEEELREMLVSERKEFNELEEEHLRVRKRKKEITTSLRNKIKIKDAEHRILENKYKDLLARFQGLSAKVRAFAVATAIEVIGGP